MEKAAFQMPCKLGFLFYGFFLFNEERGNGNWGPGELGGFQSVLWGVEGIGLGKV